MQIERRAIQRTRVLRCAKIIVPRLSSIIHCTVQNITSAGACLKLANTFGVPETLISPSNTAARGANAGSSGGQTTNSA
jgi:hypothetical protein